MLTTCQPESLHDRIASRGSVHGRSTRQAGQLDTPMIRTETGRRRLLYSAVTMYNELPTALRDLSLRRFKSEYRALLLRKQYGDDQTCAMAENQGPRSSRSCIKYTIQDPGFPRSRVKYAFQDPGFPRSHVKYTFQDPGFPWSHVQYTLQDPRFPRSHVRYTFQDPGFPRPHDKYKFQDPESSRSHNLESPRSHKYTFQDPESPRSHDK